MVGAAFGGDPRRRGLEHDPRLVDVEDLLGIAIPDDERAVLSMDQPILLQSAKRLADRCSADAAPLRHRFLDERLCRRQLTREDRVLEHLVRSSLARRWFGRERLFVGLRWSGSCCHATPYRSIVI